jgi:AcrR family transcriptional regulator
MAGKNLNEMSTAKPVPKDGSSATIALILDAAQQVLLKDGYAGFTLRRVAQSAGISPGNLTYHFPRKNVLLRALINRILADYLRQLDEMISDPEMPLEQQVEMLVHFALMDSVTEQTMRVARELWAMALHDDVIRDAADDFYDELMERVVAMLQRSYPQAEKAAIREMVHFLLLLSEGTSVLYGTRRERAVSVERMIEVATRLLTNLELNRQGEDQVSSISVGD